jgi:hypothetical protein
MATSNIFTAPVVKNNGVFQNVDPSIQQGYTSTLSDALTGKLYDPFAAGAKEALARKEASQRANTANRIADSGFSGTGIGIQAGQGTENEILQNRFASNIGIEQARANSQIAALPQALTFGQAQQQESQNAFDQAVNYGSPEDVGKAYTAMTGQVLDPMAINTMIGNVRTTTASQTAGVVNSDFAAYVTNNPGATAENDPTLKSMVQKMWTLQGNTGTPSLEWSNNAVQSVRDAGNPMIVANQAIDQAGARLGWSANEITVMKSLINQTGVIDAFDVDANGKVTPNPTRMEKALGWPAGSLSGQEPTPTTPQELSTKVSDILSTPNGYSQLTGLKAGDAVYDAVVSNSATTKVDKQTKQTAQGQDYYVHFANNDFGKVTPGTILNVGGKLYAYQSYSSVIQAGTAGSSRKTYTERLVLTDVTNGDKYTLDAGQDKPTKI